MFSVLQRVPKSFTPGSYFMRMQYKFWRPMDGCFRNKYLCRSGAHVNWHKLVFAHSYCIRRKYEPVFIDYNFSRFPCSWILLIVSTHATCSVSARTEHTALCCSHSVDIPLFCRHFVMTLNGCRPGRLVKFTTRLVAPQMIVTKTLVATYFKFSRCTVALCAASTI